VVVSRPKKEVVGGGEKKTKKSTPRKPEKRNTRRTSLESNTVGWFSIFGSFRKAPLRKAVKKGLLSGDVLGAVNYKRKGEKKKKP